LIEGFTAPVAMRRAGSLVASADTDDIGGGAVRVLLEEYTMNDRITIEGRDGAFDR
jgi:hypothetical protein